MNLIPKNLFLDDVFEDFLPKVKESNLKCDIYEKNGKYFIEMDAHGFDKNDVKIEFDNGNLSISIAKAEEKNDETKTYIRKERYSREYKRSFFVGEINPEDINAEFEHGVLRISVPKEDEVKDSKKIIDIK